MTGRTRRSLWIGAALMTAVACAGFPGSAAWVRVETRRVEVWSGVGEEPARRVAERLERMRSVAARFFPQREDAPALRVILLGSRAYASLEPSGDAAFQRATPEGAVVVVDAGSDDAQTAAQHASAHVLLRQSSEWRYPAWFEEGMAVFLSTLEAKDGRVEIGRPPDALVQQLALGSGLGLRKVLGQSGGELWSDSVRATFSAQSWTLVHFLLLGKQAGFPDRLEALKSYLAAVEVGEAPEQAFPESFGIGIEAFEEELSGYLNRIRYYTTDAGQDIVPGPARALSRAEVEVGLAQLELALGSVRWPDARARLERALRSEPDSARIRAELARVLAHLGDPAADAVLDEALARGADDAVVQRVAGDARLHAAGADPAAARALYERSIALDPAPGAAYAGLARTYLGSEDPDPGIRAALAARERLGLVDSVEQTLAELLERRGATSLASVIEAHARDAPHAGFAAYALAREGTAAVGAAARADPYLGVQLELRSPAPNARVRGVVALTEVAGRAGLGEPRHDYAVVLGETTLPEERLFDPEPTGSGLLELLGDPRHQLVRVLDAELETARALLRRVDRERDRVAILTFAEAATLYAPLSSRADAFAALGGMDLPDKLEFSSVFRSRAPLGGVRGTPASPVIGGGRGQGDQVGSRVDTSDLGPRKEPGANLAAAIRASLDALFRDARPQERRRRSILLISDGKLRPNSVAERVQVLRAAEEARLYGVVIHAVAIGRSEISANDVIRRVADVTGGKVLPVRKSEQAVASLARDPLRGLRSVEIANRTTGESARAQRIFVDGSFDGFAPLAEGANRIEIAVTFADGQTSLLERSVFFERASQPTAEEQRAGRAILESLRERGIETDLSRDATKPAPGERELEIRPEGPEDKDAPEPR